MSFDTDPSAAAAAPDPLTIDVDATPVPPAPRAVRTGRFSADDLAPPAPAPRMSGKLRPEDFATITEPAPTRPADFEPVDIAGMKAKMDTQRRAKLRPESVFAPPPAPAPPPPAPVPPPAATRGHNPHRAGAWPPGRRTSQPGADDADLVIDVSARVVDSGFHALPTNEGPPPPPFRPTTAPLARPRHPAAAEAAPAAVPPPSSPAAARGAPRATADMHPHRRRDRGPDSQPWPLSADSSIVPPAAGQRAAAARAAAAAAAQADGAASPPGPPPPPPGPPTASASPVGRPGPDEHHTAATDTAPAQRVSGDAGAGTPTRTAHAAPTATTARAAARASSGAPGLPPGLLKQCALALLSASAGTFLLTMGWSFFGAWGVLPLVWGLQALVAGLAQRFERRQQFMTASWLATLAIICTPLSVFYAQHAMGWWPPLQGLPPNTYGSGIIDIDWRRVSMDSLTTLFAWAMFMRHRHPVMLVPVTLALWYTLVEVGSYVLTARGLDLRFLAQVTAVYGLGTVLTSARIRALGRAMPAHTARRAGERPEHYAFWLEAVGALMLWAALWSYGPTSQAGRAAHLAAQLGLLGLGWRLRRHLLSGLGLLGLGLHLVALLTGELSPLALLEPLLAPLGVALSTWRH